MTNLEALNVYQNYVEAWKPIPDAQRKSILSEVFDENVEYLMPEYVGAPVQQSKTWSASKSSILVPTSTSKTSPRITRSRCSSGCSFWRTERSR